MASAANVIPKVAQISEFIPLAAAGTRQRITTTATSIAHVDAGNTFQISPLTGNPSTFIDPKTMRLRATVTISNGNVFADYLNFGPEGGYAFLDFFQLSCQSTPLETIDGVGLLEAHLARKSGEYNWKMPLYYPNETELVDSSMHINAIKPPMCDGNGYLMWQRTRNRVDYITLRNNIVSNSVGGITAREKGVVLGYFVPAIGISAPHSGTSLFDWDGQAGDQFLNNTLENNRMDPYAEIYGSTGSMAPWVNTALDAWSTSGTAFVNATVSNSGFLSYPHPAGTITSSAYDWPDLYNPAWSKPCKQFLQRGSMTQASALKSLCNIQCFPIGMESKLNIYCTKEGFDPDVYNPATKTLYIASKGTDRTPGTAWTQAAVAPIAGTTKGAPAINTGSKTLRGTMYLAVRPPNKETSFQITLDVPSNILGKRAPKYFPAMLIKAGQLIMTFRLAQMPLVGRISADPCRRIAGTIRDCVRFLGNHHGSLYGNPTSQPIGAAPYISNSLNDTTIPFNHTNVDLDGLYSRGVNPSTDPATGTPELRNNLFNWTGLGQMNMIPLLPGAGKRDAWLNTIYSEAAYTGKYMMVPFMRSTVVQKEVAADAQATHILSNTRLAGNTEDAVVTPSWGRFGVPLVVDPVPQYALVTTPWHLKASWAATDAGYANYCNELCVFYGTRLRASVPQSSRILDMTYDGSNTRRVPNTGMAVLGSYGAVDAITYRWTNIQLIYDLITLDDAATAEIINSVQAMNYNMFVRLWDVVSVPMTPGATQSIQIPINVSQCRILDFLFQDRDQRNLTVASMYDSNCGICPFTAIYPSEATSSWPTDPSLRAVNSLGRFYSSPTYHPPAEVGEEPIFGCGFRAPLVNIKVLRSNPGISVQFRAGATFIPQNPLTSIDDIIDENRKIFGSFGPKDSLMDACVSTAEVLDVAYDNTVDEGFTTPFIHHCLLDDQTIKDNQFEAALYYRNTIKSFGRYALAPRGYCLDGVYTCPSSSFYIGINTAWVRPEDGARNGLYLRAGNLTLELTGCEGLAVPGRAYQCWAIYEQYAVIRFLGGGQMAVAK